MPRPTVNEVPISLNYKHNSMSDMAIRGTDLGNDGTIKVQYPKYPSEPTITWKGRATPFKKGGAYYLKVRLKANNPDDVIPARKRGKSKKTRDLTDVSVTATNHQTNETSHPPLQISAIMANI